MRSVRRKNIYSVPEIKYIGSFIVFILLIAALYLYPRTDIGEGVKTNDIISRVARLITLPEEQPTIATVSNLEALKGQPFFMNAKVGDKVLIYSNSHKAILYRPDGDKIIEVAPFSINSAPANAK